ncbi:MAG TPA: MFS transporter [Halanaerobiales bacterium]|nr:MFS transporter [Halanaerobiales bacterium]
MEKSPRYDSRIIYLLLSYIVWGIFWGAWGVLLPAVKTAIGATDKSLGFALIGITVGALPAMLGTGLIIKRFSKWVLFYVLLFFAGSIAAITLVNTPLTLAFVLFFVGASSGMLDVVMNSGVATLESLTDKDYFNYAHAAFPVAVIFTSPTVGYVRQSGVNKNIILLVMAGIIALVGLINLKLDMKDNKKEEIKEKGFGYSSVIFQKIILLLGAIGLLVHLLENAVEQWSTIYLEQSLMSSPALASLGITGYMAMLFMGRLIAQRITGKYEDKYILTISSVISVLGFLLVSMAKIPLLVIIGYSIAGLGIAPIIPLIFSMIGKRTSPEKRVKSISSVTIIAYTGYLISPPIVGYISNIFSLNTAWIFLTFVSILLVFLIRMIKSA